LSSGVSPSVVTLTVGGNDVLGAYGDTRQALAVIRDVRLRIDEALARVAGSFDPGPRWWWGNVYDPSDGTADATRVGLPPWPDVVQVLAELNTMVAAVAWSTALRSPTSTTGFWVTA
jgi:hypothetical protein